MNTNREEELEQNFVEKGAYLEHDRWAKWQDYMFSKCVNHTINSKNGTTGIFDDIETGNLIIPRDLVERWKRQIKTKYSELTEVEKESDRYEVRKYLPLIRSLLQSERKRMTEEIEKLRPIIWSDSIEQHGRNIDKTNTLNEVLSLISKTQ